MRSLIIGYGNLGRGDDGLGPALAMAVESENIPDVEVITGFQLNVEHAFDLKGFDAVYFVDASVNGAEPYEFRKIKAEDPPFFSSHAVSPEGVLALAKKLFGIEVVGYVLAIRGYEFDVFGAPITDQARWNLVQAKECLKSELSKGAPKKA